MEDNVVPLFKKKFKETTQRDYKKKLDYLLEKEILSLEEFDDFSKFLCAIAVVISDVCVVCAYETGKVPEPSVYSQGLEKVLRRRYESENLL